MKRTVAKSRIAEQLYFHSVITLPGLQVFRAKCKCGWTAQGHKRTVSDKVYEHQAVVIVNSLFGNEAELVED